MVDTEGGAHFERGAAHEEALGRVAHVAVASGLLRAAARVGGHAPGACAARGRGLEAWILNL